MKKIKEVIFNALVYRTTSITLQVLMVSMVFGLITNWKVVAACNALCFTWYVIYHMMAIKIRRKLKNTHPSVIVKAYLSHAIRGSAGENPTCEIQMSNCDIARAGAAVLRSRFPFLDLYVPAEAERFVYHTFNDKLLTDTQILAVDCKILDICDVLIAYDFDKSKGVEIEVKYAREHSIPIFRFKEINKKTMKELKNFLRDLTTVKRVLNETNQTY